MRRAFGGTTPGRLRGAMLGLALLAALAGAVSLWAAADMRGTVQTVGHDAEPSVALSLRITATLGGMDAAALADALVDNGAAGGTSAAFRLGALTLADDIVKAAQNITYGETEAAPLRALTRAVLAYQEAVAEARTYGAGNAAVTRSRVLWASRVNRDFAAPPAAELFEVNGQALNGRYVHYRSGSLLEGGAAVAGFGLLVLALLAVQAWLARRTRRTVNPMLAGATLVAAAAGLWLGSAVLTAREDLRVAKSDAYDSILSLFQAKGAANALRAEMSFWLFDPASRTASQAQMEAQLRTLVQEDIRTPARAGAVRAKLDDAYRAEEAGRPGEAKATAPRLGGLLGAELDNITFGPQERLYASDSVMALAAAWRIAGQVQALELGGEGGRARAQWLSDDLGGGAAGFDDLQSALDGTIAVNQAEFDRSVAAALRTAAVMPYVTTGALALAALLAVGGLWQRLREYR